MNLNSSVAGIQDSLTELVGIKTGLALTRNELIRVLDRELGRESPDRWFYSPHSWLHSTPHEWVRLRAEEFESLVIRVMYGIGAIPDPDTPMQLIRRFAMESPGYAESIPAGSDEEEAPFPVFPVMRLIWRVSELANSSDAPPPELRATVEEYRRRSILSVMMGLERISWNGVTHLSELFHLSHLGATQSGNLESTPLIDQRFIDYLNSQPADLERIHWRQFEYLVGEYFRRSGYQVTVTPPSGDGGIDATAVRDDNALGPELVFVQAKRLAGSNQVGIDSVKALWTDVNDQFATRGVIATTTVLARGAREFCEARKYRISAAERDDVNSWIERLATYPK